MTSSSATDNGLTAVLRLHSLGDVVLAQPAAAELAKAGRVSFVTSSEYSPVVRRMEGVEPASHRRDSGAAGLRRLLRDLAPARIVDLQNNLTTRIATLGMPVTGRFSLRRGLRRRVLAGGAGSMPSRRVDFLMAAGSDSGGMPALSRHSPVPDRLRVGITAGSRWRLKSIPEGVVAETARLFIDLHGAEVVITGGPGEEGMVAGAAASVMRDGVSTYCGEDGMEGLTGVLEGLSLLVSPDSGPAHLAAALGVPVMVVFTSTSPALGFWEEGYASYFFSGSLECRPCHRHGGKVCSRGDEACRGGILPLELVTASMGMIDR